MIRGITACILMSLASCVPSTSQLTTRTAKDDEILKTRAIVRPKLPDPRDHENYLGQARTMVVAQGDGISRGSLGQSVNFEAIVEPGRRSIRASSSIPPRTAIGQLDFQVEKGKIYRFKAHQSPGSPSRHLWELYEEDSGRVILKKEVEATPNRPFAMPLPVS